MGTNIAGGVARDKPEVYKAVTKAVERLRERVPEDTAHFHIVVGSEAKHALDDGYSETNPNFEAPLRFENMPVLWSEGLPDDHAILISDMIQAEGSDAFQVDVTDPVEADEQPDPPVESAFDRGSVTNPLHKKVKNVMDVAHRVEPIDIPVDG